MNKKVRGILLEILSDNNKEEPEEITLNTSLRNDLNFDSLDLAVLTVKIEEEFDVDIFEDGIIDTVSDIIKKIS